MKIFLQEISDQDTFLNFTDQDDWVKAAVSRVDEVKADDPTLKPIQKADLRSIHVDFTLRKVDQVVVLSGHVDTYLRLLCSRCAMPFQLTCKPSFSALFCKDPIMAGVAHREDSGKVSGQNKGSARHAHDFDENGDDLDITYVTQDWIELGDVLTEQLQLQVPFQPLCNEACKGVCTHCGTDLNKHRCACAKLQSRNPFSVLREMKL